MTRQTKRRSMLWALFLTILAGRLNAQGNAVNPLWESAVECIMKYESWHGPEHYPYVAFGHRIRPGERFPSRLTRKEGEQLLRKDLKELCVLFRHLGKDSLLLSEISDNSSYPNPSIILKIQFFFCKSFCYRMNRFG